MRNFYHENLKLIENIDKDIANKIVNCNSNLYTLKENKFSKINLLYHKINNKWVSLHDPFDPKTHVRSFLNKIKVKKTNFVVLFGLGLGYVPLELYTSGDGPGKLIVVERDVECLKRAMEAHSLADVLSNPNVKLIVGVPESSLYMAMFHAIEPHFVGAKEAMLIAWPASVSLDNSYYESARKAFADATNIWIAERGNDPYDTLVAYEHFLLNIEDYLNYPGAGYVKDFFEGRPAIVVATGPSLKKNIHLLKQAEGNAVIIAADASLRALHKHGIYPHMITTVERPPGPGLFYKGLDNLEKTILAVISFAHPSTLDSYGGPKLFFNRYYSFFEKALGLAEDCTQMGLSTANMAYEVARHMGCDPIVLVGNDLAFDEDGNTHAPGFAHGEKQDLFEDFDRIEVPGNYQSTVMTCDGWFNCIKQYEKRIKGWDGTLINSTAGGAKINGSVVMGLSEVLKNYCSKAFYPRDLLQNHMARWESPYSPEIMISRIEKSMKSVSWGVSICSKMLAALTPLVLEIDGCKDKIPTHIANQIQAYLPHLGAVLDQLEHSPLLTDFREYFFTEMIPLLMEWQVIGDRFENPAWAAAYRLKLSEEFFGAMGQVCLSLEHVLQDGIKRLALLKAN